MHHARDDAESLGVVDERVGASRLSRSREVRPAALERVAPRVDGAGYERLHHPRVVDAIGAFELEAELAEQRGVLAKPACVVRKRVTSTSGFRPGVERSEKFENRAIADDDRRVALLRAIRHASRPTKAASMRWSESASMTQLRCRVAPSIDEPCTARTRKAVAKVGVVHRVVDRRRLAIDCGACAIDRARRNVRAR